MLGLLFFCLSRLNCGSCAAVWSRHALRCSSWSNSSSTGTEQEQRQHTTGRQHQQPPLVEKQQQGSYIYLQQLGQAMGSTGSSSGCPIPAAATSTMRAVTPCSLPGGPAAAAATWGPAPRSPTGHQPAHWRHVSKAAGGGGSRGGGQCSSTACGALGSSSLCTAGQQGPWVPLLAVSAAAEVSRWCQ